MLDIDPKSQIHKIWFSVDGEPLELFGNPRLSHWNRDEGTLEVAVTGLSPESEALMSKKKFLYERNVEVLIRLEAKPTKPECQATNATALREYEIKEQIPGETRAIAWYEIGEGMDATAVTLEIVANSEVKSSCQVWIGDGGKIKVSPDLIGKAINIQVPAILPTRVVILRDPLDQFQAHLIKEAFEQFWYYEFDCTLKKANKQQLICDAVLVREEFLE